MALKGNLTDMNVSDLIQAQCRSGGRSALVVERDGREGTIFFDDGAVIHAVCGNELGEPAVYELLTWETGAFEVVPDLRPALITIKVPWAALIMEGMRRYDERRTSLADAPPEDVVETESRRSRAEKLLRNLVASSGDVIGAAVVDLDGQILAAELPTRIDQPRAGAAAAACAALAQRSAKGLAAGDVSLIAIRGAEHDVVLSPVGAFAVLIALAKPAANLGMVFLQVKACAASVAGVSG